MKKLILLSLFALTTAAAAESQAPTSKLDCGFTEPFFNLNIDLVEKRVTRTEYDFDDIDPKSDFITTVIAENIVIQANLSDPFLPTYVVLKQDGSWIADLALNMKGSDAMSDIVYPFDIKYSDFWGGCSSDKIDRWSPHE